MDPQSLFLSLGVHPNLKAVPPEVARSQINGYMERQRLLRDAIVGTMNPDDYLDSLNDAGIGVDQYLEQMDLMLQPLL